MPWGRASAVVFGLVYVLIRRAVRLERGQGASVGSWRFVIVALVIIGTD